jgi:hypothetical protein
MITVELVGDERLIARLDAMPGRMHDGIARTVARLGLELHRKVVMEKLNGQVLQRRTGARASQVNDRFTDTPTEISYSVGIPPKSYGRFHEFGVPHSWVTEARNAKALRFTVGGETIFCRRVTHPPLPERSFLRSALKEMAPMIEEELRAAVAEAIR